MLGVRRAAFAADELLTVRQSGSGSGGSRVAERDLGGRGVE